PLKALKSECGLGAHVEIEFVWKQSLAKLSGGRRSLITLFLIMSLLQFKPAPIMIYSRRNLCEIHTALDLSHSQHIRQLFRTRRFKGLQFIVFVSDGGLFTKANVLLKTCFR
ncbi:hypothetical protein C8R45DRAFT_795754, partial [Mycena sanguinolenta]